MNSIHLNDHLVNQPREKRMKVSRACFTCRVKKIKCDGVQPCMQCKARRRPCSFSKDGTVDQTQPSPDLESSVAENAHTGDKRRRPSLSQSPKLEPSPSITLYQTPSTSTQVAKAKEQEELRKSSQQLDKLSMMWPGEGKEGRWLVDINLLFNGAEENYIQKPSQQEQSPNINPSLLNSFFRHRYTTFPIFPKSMFYGLLERGDSLINNLLLHSMYCNAAHFSHEYAPEADNYYKQAQMLLDTYVDTPSLGTVIALCLLSTYESNRHGTGPHAGKNRSRLYGDMAFRMCLDLKLHKRYSFHNSDATPDDNELRKRAYWACYCLDKMQSLVTGRPLLLSSKGIDIDFPMVLRSDDPSEYEINTCFVEHIKLMQICERVLQLEIPNRQNNLMRSTENEQTVLELDGQLLYWLRSLPQQLQWTPLDTERDVIPTQPPSNALVAQLNLIYNFVEISLLQPHASTSLSSSPATLVIQQRCATVATNITQLTCAMADQPNFIMSFTLVAEAIMAAVRVHIMDCADEKMAIARHARFMFQRSLRSLRSILHHRVIDRIQEFTTTIERALADADTGNSNSRNSSPKLHVLSPVIPRTPGNVLHQEHNGANLDERWATRFNNTSNMYPYGLISPASSTASAPVEKSNMTRDEELIRPHSSLANTLYNATTNTMYSRTSTSSSSFVPPSSTPSSWRSPVLSSQQLSPAKNFGRPPTSTAEQMEMYSNIWSRSNPTSNDVFSSNSNDQFDTSFLGTRPQRSSNDTMKEEAAYSQTTTTTTNTMNADAELYSIWDQQAEKNADRPEEEQAAPIMFTPQQTGRYGLGVYASAQQHHTDVIRQHMPNMKSSNLNRPVLLNHHGQVVVVPSDIN
ncbi:unnamed protein product [Mucor hiemalis]